MAITYADLCFPGCFLTKRAGGPLGMAAEPPVALPAAFPKVASLFKRANPVLQPQATGPGMYESMLMPGLAGAGIGAAGGFGLGALAEDPEEKKRKAILGALAGGGGGALFGLLTRGMQGGAAKPMAGSLPAANATGSGAAMLPGPPPGAAKPGGGPPPLAAKPNPVPPMP